MRMYVQAFENSAFRRESELPAVWLRAWAPNCAAAAPGSELLPEAPDFPGTPNHCITATHAPSGLPLSARRIYTHEGTFKGR